MIGVDGWCCVDGCVQWRSEAHGSSVGDVDGLVAPGSVTGPEHDPQPSGLGRVGGDEGGVDLADRDERRVAGGQHLAFLAHPLLDRSGAQEKHLLLIGVTVEVVALAGSDLDVEHAQPLPLRHVGRPDDPPEITPVEFLPLDVFHADETHQWSPLFVRSLDIR